MKVNGQLLNHQTSQNLYGLHLNKANIKKHKRVYIFEGEKSVMKCEAYYPDNNFSVSVSGSNISQWQVDKILSLGVEHVIIAFDNFREQKIEEEEFVYQNQIIHYQERLLALAHKFATYCRTYILWDFDGDKLGYSDSPVDRGKKVFEYLTDTKLEVKTKDFE